MKLKNSLVAALLAALTCLVTGIVPAQDIHLSVQSGHSAKILDVRFSPNGALLATAGADHNIVIWEIKSGRQLMVMTGHTDAVNRLEFHQDGNIIASASDDQTVRLWSLAESKQTGIYSDFGYPVKALQFSDDGKTLFTAGKLIRAIEWKTGSSYTLDIIAKHSFDAIAAKGDWIAFGGKQEPSVEIVSLSTKAVTGHHAFHSTDLVFDSSGAELFGSSYYSRVASWEVQGIRHKSATGYNSLNAFTSVAVNKKHFCVGDQEGKIHVYDRENWKVVQTLKAHSQGITGIDISPDQRYLVSAGEDDLILIWDLEAGHIAKIFAQNAGKINCIRFSDDGNTLVYGYDDGRVRDWNLESNQIRTAAISHSKSKIQRNWNFSVTGIRDLNDSSIVFDLVETQRSDEDEKRLVKLRQYDLKWHMASGDLLPDERPAGSKDLESEYFSALRKGNAPGPAWFLDTAALRDEDATGKFIAEALDGDLILRKNGSGEIIFRIPTGHTDRITSVRFNPVYPYIATASWDGLVKFWDTATGMMISTLGAYDESDFIFIDSQNHYFASKGALGKIAFRIGLHAFAFDQFDLKFNRPDLVLAKLPYFRHEAITNFHRAWKKRLQKLGIGEEELFIDPNLPEISVELPSELITKSGSINFAVSASDNHADLRRLHVLVNGVPEFGKLGIEISGKSVRKEIQLSLNPGANEIESFVINEKGKSSFKQSFQVISREHADRPELFLIAIGASKFNQSEFNLDYAEKDARDIGLQFDGTRQFSAVRTKMLLNEEVTKENVLSLSEFVKPAGVNDVILLFAAGHGLLDTGLNYYFASHDVDFDNPASCGIPYDAFDNLLDDTKSRKKVMFMDACHSGEIDKDEVVAVEAGKSEQGEIKFRNVGTTIAQKGGQGVSAFELSRTLFADMRTDNGSTVVSSARGGEFAMEGKNWNNGVFTYCLLRGIESRFADLNRDRRIMLSELQEYLLEEVGQLTNGLQTPTSRSENLINDFRLW